MRLFLAIPLLLALAVPPSPAQLRKGPMVGPKGKAARNAKKAQAIDKFHEMSPEDRRKVLDNLPPERRKQVEKNYEQYRSLDDNQKARLNNQLGDFRKLPPEKQQAARTAFRKMNDMPTDRKVEMRREITRLRRMTPEDRESRLQSDEFRGHYSADERAILRDLSDLYSHDE